MCSNKYDKTKDNMNTILLCRSPHKKESESTVNRENDKKLVDSTEKKK